MKTSIIVDAKLKDSLASSIGKLENNIKFKYDPESSKLEFDIEEDKLDEVAQLIRDQFDHKKNSIN